MNTKYLILIAYSFVILSITLSCDDTNYNLNPAAEFDFEKGRLEIDTLYAVSDSIIRKSDINTFGATKTSIGNYNGFEAGFLFLATSLTSVFFDSLEVIDSVKIQFWTLNSYGADFQDQIIVDAYNYNNTINVDSFNTAKYWRNPLSRNLEYLSQVAISSKDSAKSTFSFSAEIFNNWISTQNDTVAIYFHPAIPGEGIVEIQSGSSSTSGLKNDPILIAYRTDSSGVVADTIQNVAGFSTFIHTVNIFNYDEISGTALNNEEDKIIVSSGIVTTSLLNFDFSVLPDNAIYYSSDLVLTEDENNEFENPSASPFFLVNAVEQNNSSLTRLSTSTYVIEKQNGVTRLGSDARLFSGEMVQGIKNNYFTYDWFEIWNNFLTREINVIKFYGSKAPPEVAPKLIVKYYIKEI